MNTVAENLKPPFIAAILLDIDEQPGRADIAPSDEMISLAPAQAGFLGLETTHDSSERWIAITYWRDDESFKAWRQTGAKRIAEVCGVDLDSVCKFRVSKVDQPLYPKKNLTAKLPAVPDHNRGQAGIGAVIFSAFPAIAEFLGYEHVR